MAVRSPLSGKQIAKNPNYLRGYESERWHDGLVRLRYKFVAVGVDMSWTFFDLITINISRPLEALFDEIEYRLARRVARSISMMKHIRGAESSLRRGSKMEIRSG
jgi:hypothetical protein